MKILGQYRNGNYDVTIYSDGTKVRENDLNFFDAEFPESMDIKITNCCDLGCPMCHEDSTPEGAHGDILTLPFINSLRPYTELAIGGGNPLAHPDLIEFLQQLKDRNLIANITVNQFHFMKNIPLLTELTEQGLIHGLGVSYTGGNYGSTMAFIDQITAFPNAVIHVINGIITVEQLSWLSGWDLKILILGYKDFRRGVKYREKELEQILHCKGRLYEELPAIIGGEWFTAVSFDNLAISQLDVKRLMCDSEWNEFFMGDDGRDGELSSASMYVDAVKGEFARNSCSESRYTITDDIVEMFKFLKSGEEV